MSTTQELLAANERYDALKERVTSTMTNLWELSSMLDPESEYGKGFLRAVKFASIELDNS